MIKAAELRIGNRILFEGKEIICKEISSDGINWDEVQYVGRVVIKYEQLNPIPLTEEWLLRFGLIKYNESEFYVNDVSRCTELLRLFKSDYGFNISHYITNIQYVHQLQNIYFVLAGSELEIK